MLNKLNLFGAVLTATSLVACAQAPAQLSPSSSAPRTLAEAYKMGATVKGSSLLLHGTYQGWSGCPSSAALTRSDWVIQTDAGCIFVTGGLPAGIVPPPSKVSNGMPVYINVKMGWDEVSKRPFASFK